MMYNVNYHSRQNKVIPLFCAEVSPEESREIRRRYQKIKLPDNVKKLPVSKQRHKLERPVKKQENYFQSGGGYVCEEVPVGWKKKIFDEEVEEETFDNLPVQSFQSLLRQMFGSCSMSQRLAFDRNMDF